MSNDESITYVAKVERGTDCFLITFPDLPEARTFVWFYDEGSKGRTAMECLRAALNGRARDREPYPEPRFQGEGSAGRLVLTVSRAALKRASNQP